MLFVFTHMDFDCDGTKWNPVPFKLTALKQTLGDQQRAVHEPAGRACSTATTTSRAPPPAGATNPRAPRRPSA